MDINNMMTSEIFTMNDKHTVRTRTQHNTESCSHGSNLLESLIELSVSVTILLFTVKSKFSLQNVYAIAFQTGVLLYHPFCMPQQTPPLLSRVPWFCSVVFKATVVTTPQSQSRVRLTWNGQRLIRFA